MSSCLLGCIASCRCMAQGVSGPGAAGSSKAGVRISQGMGPWAIAAWHMLTWPQPRCWLPGAEKELPQGSQPSAVFGTAAKLPSHQNLAFSWGPRSCPGQRLGAHQVAPACSCWQLLAPPTPACLHAVLLACCTPVMHPAEQRMGGPAKSRWADIRVAGRHEGSGLCMPRQPSLLSADFLCMLTCCFCSCGPLCLS